MFTLTRSGLDYDILGFMVLDVEIIGIYVGIGSNPQRGELWRVNLTTGATISENGSVVQNVPADILKSITDLRNNLATWLDAADQAAPALAKAYQAKLAAATPELPCTDPPSLNWIFKNY